MQMNLKNIFIATRIICLLVIMKQLKRIY